MGNRRTHKLYVLLATSLIASSFAGCFKDPRTSGDQMNNLAVSTVPGGPRFVKVKFQASDPTVQPVLGSFNANPSPTSAGIGNGLKAVRFFNEADLEISPVNVPWIEWVEVSISGTSGTTGTGNPGCFRFVNTTETNVICGGFNCGAPAGYLRLSEFDCSNPGPAPDANNIHIAVKFRKDPSRLAPHENVQVALTYIASALTPASDDPSACFTGGVFSPQNPGCSDLTWHARLTENAIDTVQPFKLLIPPITNLMTALTNRRSGATTQTFVVPLAYNNIQHLVLSRTAGHIPAGANCLANSPGCVGVIFIEMILMRI